MFLDCRTAVNSQSGVRTPLGGIVTGRLSLFYSFFTVANFPSFFKFLSCYKLVFLSMCFLFFWHPTFKPLRSVIAKGAIQIYLDLCIDLSVTIAAEQDGYPVIFPFFTHCIRVCLSAGLHKTENISSLNATYWLEILYVRHAQFCLVVFFSCLSGSHALRCDTVTFSYY